MQGREKLLVVTRVQADGGLVQNVKNATEVRAELRRQPNALGFAAAEGGHAAAELEVTKADIIQKLQALTNLGNDIARDHTGAAFEAECLEELERLLHRHLRKNVDVGRASVPARGEFRQTQPHGPGDRIQASTLTIRTDFAAAFLPFEPRFLNGVGAGAAIHIRQIEKFAKPAAVRAPTLGRVVAENLRINRRE